MSLNTIYLWEPEIFTGKVPSEDDSYQVAFELHQQYSHIPSHGRTLKAWLTSFANKVCDPLYQAYFSEHTQKWVQQIRHKFDQETCAVVQLDALEQVEQNDAMYRVFYEAVHETGVGFYEPNYNVWAIGELQSPENAVVMMLQPYLLKPLEIKQEPASVSSEPQPQVEAVVESSQFPIPQNMPEAEQLISQWFEQQSYTKNLELSVFNVAHDFISNWGNLGKPQLAKDTGYRCFLLTQEQAGIFYQLKMVLRKLTISPMLSFAMDFTNHFIPQHLQEQLPERLIFRLRSMDVHKNTGLKNSTEPCFALTGRWDTQVDIQEFFQNLDGYINFIFSNLGQGRLETLQAWAYGDMPADIKIDLDFRFELMMIALSQDEDYLGERYQHHKTLLTLNKARVHDLGLLEDSYKFCQKLIKIVKDGGTALQPYAAKS
ncbi:MULTISPECIES: hypothetical protein [Acinetobacter]|uniref:Uncharacterized protein n=1 Tax=Acinetobacter corruptisaponis TaxID=3045147 RepID=A0ABY8S6X9_9GAMM|nr:hypothetical protein [Acinetobacter sp. KCTC 92772]WHP06518.1 hypothetical protein QLH32_03360 [Acinetobacter sp. KCTC 92772]